MAYDKVNRETLWKVLRMYDVEGKLSSGIKSMYVDSSACVKIKEGESERFRIDSGVRQGCIMSPWLKNGKAAGKDEVTGEMVMDGGDTVMEWIWKLCNMAFKISIVTED